MIFINRFWHFTKFDIKIKSENICTLFLTKGDINGFHRRLVKEQMLLKTLRTIDVQTILWGKSVNFRLSHLSWLQLIWMLNNLKLLHLGLCNLCIMFKDALSFFRSFKIFAADTFTTAITWNASLKTFAIFFQTFASLAITSFSMSLSLPTFTSKICGTLFNVWIVLAGIVLITLVCLLMSNSKRLFTIWFLWWRRPQYRLSLVFNWTTNASNWDTALAYLRIHIVCFCLICCNFCSKCIRISIKDIWYSFCSFNFIFTVVFTVWAMAMLTAIFTSSKTFTVEFQTLRVFAWTPFLFSGHWLLLMQMTWSGWVILLHHVSVLVDWSV